MVMSFSFLGIGRSEKRARRRDVAVVCRGGNWKLVRMGEMGRWRLGGGWVESLCSRHSELVCWLGI